MLLRVLPITLVAFVGHLLYLFQFQTVPRERSLVHLLHHFAHIQRCVLELHLVFLTPDLLLFLLLGDMLKEPLLYLLVFNDLLLKLLNRCLSYRHCIYTDVPESINSRLFFGHAHLMLHQLQIHFILILRRGNCRSKTALHSGLGT